MAVDPIGAIAALTQFLTGFPQPDDVAEALALGALAPLDPVGVQLFERMSDTFPPSDELVSIGSFGVVDDVLERYGRMPVSLDLPVCEAVRDSQLVLTTIGSLISGYKPLQVDAAMWEPVVTDATFSRGTTVCLPLVARGHSIGALTFFATVPYGLGVPEQKVLELVGHVLGLWLAGRFDRRRPRNGVSGGPTPLLSLSERQIDILQRIDAGASNAAIAAALECSVSTVKQEIRRMNAALRTSGRTELVERAQELALLPLTEST